jgi:hypothetical protein
MKTNIYLKLVVRLTIFLATFAITDAADTVAGKWESQPPGEKTTFDFKVDAHTLSGTVTVGGTAFPVESGKVDSKTIAFSWTTAFPPMGNPVRRSAKGTLDGEKITLAIEGLIESTQEKFTETLTLKRPK